MAADTNADCMDATDRAPICTHDDAPLSIQDIADECGTTKSRLHVDVVSRQALFIVAKESLFSDFEVTLTRIDGPPLARLDAVLDRLLPAPNADRYAFNLAIPEVRVDGPHIERYQTTRVRNDELVHETRTELNRASHTRGTIATERHPDAFARLVRSPVDGARMRGLTTDLEVNAAADRGAIGPSPVVERQ